jgi:hypothetical protein
MKYFVVLCHERRDGVLYCVSLKATSRTQIYDNMPEKMAGAVCYEAGEACFKERTIIQPDNPWPISHQDIVKHRRAGAFGIVGNLPADFHCRLIAAIKASPTMSPTWRRSMLAMIEAQ